MFENASERQKAILDCLGNAVRRDIEGQCEVYLERCATAQAGELQHYTNNLINQLDRTLSAAKMATEAVMKSFNGPIR